MFTKGSLYLASLKVTHISAFCNLTSVVLKKLSCLPFSGKSLESDSSRRMRGARAVGGRLWGGPLSNGHVFVGVATCRVGVGVSEESQGEWKACRCLVGVQVGRVHLGNLPHCGAGQRLGLSRASASPARTCPNAIFCTPAMSPVVSSTTPNTRSSERPRPHSSATVRNAPVALSVNSRRASSHCHRSL